jgi:NDP-sugar pyrophosphorylase family protein
MSTRASSKEIQIIIPMSGRGERFRAAGFASIKPLIEVDGRPLIEHVIGLFPGQQDFLFICASDHLEQTALGATLKRIAPTGRLLPIQPHKLGPVHAVLLAEKEIDDERPCLVNYCDFSAYWDYAEFLRYVQSSNCDGCIPAYRGFHPHSLGPNHYAYMRTAEDRVLEIREKLAFTRNRMQEYASSGSYYFKTGKLMKETFRRAVAQKLSTNGEFYASMPFNLLIKDKQDVRVYPLEHFVQLGTPEDVQEYQAWSDWFRDSSEWCPRLDETPGTNLIPMAGSGERFRKQGYTVPKPFVPVSGVPMLERSLRTLPPATKWLAVCREELAHDPKFEVIERAIGAPLNRAALSAATQGQLSTCLAAEKQLDPDAPLFISACDAGFVFDEHRWQVLQADPQVEFAVWTFRNHPHANRHPEQYGWVAAGEDGRIRSVSVKQALGPQVSRGIARDPGVTGTFWFRRASIFLEAAHKIVAENRRVNGEFYVDTVTAWLAEQGRHGRLFDVSHFLCYGTPDDVRTFEYWSAYFEKLARRDQAARRAAAGTKR